jgi:general secretion pathway protein G
MIVSTNRRLAARRRAAFTLLEVLVVVAILLVLASVASIAVFRYLEEAKVDRAKLDMQALVTAYEGYQIKNGGVPPESVVELVPYLKQGQSALVDPWGNQYSYQILPTDTGDRVQFFTTGNIKVVWPEK